MKWVSNTEVFVLCSYVRQKLFYVSYVIYIFMLKETKKKRTLIVIVIRYVKH